MSRFRPFISNAPPAASLDLLAISQLIDDAMQPGHFFAAPELRLIWIAARSETIPWEIFRGRLLDAKQTREQKSFLSWHVKEGAAAEPMISVKLDVHARQIHITRGLLCHVWEAFDAGGGVIDSRETVQWTRELVGTITLADFNDLEAFRDELICQLWQAIVGTTRLPLTSVEAPLPAFAFGQFHYLYAADSPESDQSLATWEGWLQRGLQPGLAWREYVKLVEVVLRCVTQEELPRMTDLFLAQWPRLGVSLPRLLRALFNDVSLSPYTRFVDNTLAWVDLLMQQGALASDDKIDFFSHLLRQLGRHLTAYDLVTFHHRGANYPDALLLDTVLKRYMREIDARPDRCRGSDTRARLRRRALRQGCLTRRHYEGHLVPDLPTSPGENARVMPASHPRVSEEQLTHTTRRRRQLFVDEPLPDLLNEKARNFLAQSVSDLEHLDERVEMGLGLFIDRPFGYAKSVGEPDLTPLLAHETFSPSQARRRWRELKSLCEELSIPCDFATLDPLFENGPWPAGLPHTALAECPRPTAALADVRKVADDFVILRTLPGGLAALLVRFDLHRLTARFPLRFLDEGTPRLCVQTRNESGQPVLALFDSDCRRRLELVVDDRQGYVNRAGVEWPRAGLRVLTIGADTSDPAALKQEDGVESLVIGEWRND